MLSLEGSFVLKFSTDNDLLRHLTSVYFSPLFCRVSHVHWYVMVNCKSLLQSCCSYVLRFARVKDCVLHVAAFSEGAFFDIRYMHLASLAKLSSTSSSACSVIAHASAAFHLHTCICISHACMSRGLQLTEGVVQMCIETPSYVAAVVNRCWIGIDVRGPTHSEPCRLCNQSCAPACTACWSSRRQVLLEQPH